MVLLSNASNIQAYFRKACSGALNSNDVILKQNILDKTDASSSISIMTCESEEFIKEKQRYLIRDIFSLTTPIIYYNHKILASNHHNAPRCLKALC